MRLWNEWCRLCGCTEAEIETDQNVKEAMTQVFKVDDSAAYTCFDCNAYVKDFLEFRRRSKLVSDMFQELKIREPQSEEEATEFREIFFSQANTIEMVEDNDSVFETIENETLPVDTDEPASNLEDEETKSKNLEKNFTFNCHICGINFKDMFYLSTHCRTVHKCLPEVDCTVCGRKLQTSKAVTYHIELHYQNVFKFCCPYFDCKKPYKIKSNLDNHLKFAHSCEATKTFKQYKCNQCAKEFKELRHLTVHLNSHLPDTEKYIYPCEFCKKKYSSTFVLKNHIKHVHKREEKFDCSECGKKFARKADLLSHLFVHTNQKNFGCDICGMKLKTKANLRVHKKIHSTDFVTCDTCGRNFKTEQQLRNHKITHTNERKYQCDLCSVSYNRSKELQNHIFSIHLNIRRYQCDQCDKTFATKTNFRKHKKTLHANGVKEIASC